MNWEYVCCPGCHHDSFNVRREGGHQQLLCRACGLVVFDSQPIIVEKPTKQTTMSPI